MSARFPYLTPLFFSYFKCYETRVHAASLGHALQPNRVKSLAIFA